jgi:membrane-associated protein
MTSGASPEPGRRSNVRWVRGGLLILLLAALVASLASGARTYRSLILLQSAQELGAADTSSIRPWMTIEYVAAVYGVDEEALLSELGVSADTDAQSTLRSLAEERGTTPFTYVQSVQSAVANIRTEQAVPTEAADGGWLDTIKDAFLSAVLVYGYPALALTLFVGAIGLPVPTGLSTTVAGSLASQGYLDWGPAVGIVVAASLLGDLVGYGLGRGLNEGFISRWGHWFAYTRSNRLRVEALFARWGPMTIVLTRTLASHMSSVVSLLAGLSRYRLAGFLAYAAAGRMLWAAAYFGLGYSIGADLEAASRFLGNLSVFLVTVAVSIAAAVALSRKWRL